MIKHPLVAGILAGALCVSAGFLAAGRPSPAPLLQPDPRFSRNVDIPGNSFETVWYMQIEVDGHTAYFSCVKHDFDASIPTNPGVIPK